MNQQNKNDAADQLLLDELNGKKTAYHEYDKIIWKVRAGYVTVLFAGLGYLLNLLMINVENSKVVGTYKWEIIVLTIFWSLVCFGLDRSYIIRKYRLVKAVNKIQKHFLGENYSCSSDPRVRKKVMKNLNMIGESNVLGFSSGITLEGMIEIALYCPPILLVVLELLKLDAFFS